MNSLSNKYLIVNADDFGQSAGINRGIIAAHEQGIVTSASLMVRWRDAQEAAAYASAHPELSVGLHLDLGEWIFREGEWQPLYQVTDTDDEISVRSEVKHQLALFQSLVGKSPTHIDSHQHAHLREPARSIVARAAAEFGCPLRSCSAEVAYVGGFYGQTAEGEPLSDVISIAGLKRILAELGEGVSELGCHPGFVDDLDTMYKHERAEEVAVLCEARIKRALHDLRIELISFHQVPVGV